MLLVTYWLESFKFKLLNFITSLCYRAVKEAVSVPVLANGNIQVGENLKKNLKKLIVNWLSKMGVSRSLSYPKGYLLLIILLNKNLNF